MFTSPLRREEGGREETGRGGPVRSDLTQRFPLSSCRSQRVQNMEKKLENMTEMMEKMMGMMSRMGSGKEAVREDGSGNNSGETHLFFCCSSRDELTCFRLSLQSSLSRTSPSGSECRRDVETVTI